MKKSYFYKKTIGYFSLIIFTLITLVLFFVNYKTNDVYKYILEKSQKQVNAGSEMVEELIERDILAFIRDISEKNKNELNELLKNPIIRDLIVKNKVKEIEELLNINNEIYSQRTITINTEKNLKRDKKIDVYDKGIRFSSFQEISINNIVYSIQLRNCLNRDFVKTIKKEFITHGNLIILDELKKSKLRVKFEEEKLSRVVEKMGLLQDLYKVYIPLYGDDKKLTAIIFYEVDMSFYNKLNSSMVEESNVFFNSIKLYVLLFSLVFYLASIVLITLLLKKVYDPLEEVFGVIDDLSKGIFGRKIFLDNREELKPLVKKINRLSGNLNFINRIKNEFLVKKSYEFKEVLDNIVGISEELIKDRNINNNLKEDLRIIYENSNKLLTITKGLNDYYILEDDSIELNESINIKRIISEVSAILNNELKDKDLYINNLISERIYVKGDNLKLFILIMNLLDNSIKNSQGSEIRVESVLIGKMLRVIISDKGRGINRNKLINLQNYFKDSDETEDIGLGFVLAKKIIALHGGSIELWSREGEGTEISFSLKEALSISDRNKEKLEELKKELDLDNVYGENKIVIYCNNYFNCKILINFLKTKNFIIKIVETKEELLNHLEKEKSKLLLIDVLGDFVNDYRLINEIRRKYSVKELPIIYINNRKKLDDDFSIFDLGINDILDKPLSKDKLLIKVENQLELLNSQKENETLIKAREMVESVSNIQEEINSTLDTKKIFSILLKKIKELLDFDSAFILLKKDGKYNIIFQEGYFDKEEKNDRLFKSRYLDPLTNSGKILRLSKYRCKKYFGEKTKSSLLIPFKYGSNSNCLIVLKSKKENFFGVLSKELIDKISFNLSNSIKNAELFNELEEKNNHLNDLFHTLQSIDKLISIVYKEQDKNTAVYYILLILINKLKLGYKEAYYFEFDEKTNVLSCTNYFYSLKNYTEEKENKVSSKELWSKKIKLKLEKKNILTRAFKEESTLYEKELTTEDFELFGKMLKITVIPVKYIDEKFGLIVLESERKRKSVDEIEKEALRIIAANLGIYLHNKKLEKENIKTSSSKTLNTFAKAIIHELRTPIVGVKGFASLVKEKYSSDTKLVNYMENIINDSNRVLDLSSQIVDYAEEENMVYNCIEDDIKNTLEEVLYEFREQIELESLQIIKPKEDLVLVYDKQKIKRVFRHLIKNVLENMDYEKEENILKISFEKNSLGFFNIVFFDNGVGIDEENIGDIFEPLVSGKIQGTGLGLPISKSIIEKHNWDLKLESVRYNYTKVMIATK